MSGGLERALAKSSNQMGGFVCWRRPSSWSCRPLAHPFSSVSTPFDVWSGCILCQCSEPSSRVSSYVVQSFGQYTSWLWSLVAKLQGRKRRSSVPQQIPLNHSGRILCPLQKRCTTSFPTMCILTIKCGKNLLPQCAKSWIVVLGNHEDRLWSKSDKFTPVLCGNLLRFLISMAIQRRHPLCQGDCKNAFCQGILPPEEVTIVRPPSGDPNADPQEYGFSCILSMVYTKALITGMTK